MTEVFWLEQALASVPADDDWLSAPERMRLAALRIPKRRAEWRLGRWTAKQALAAFSGSPPDRRPLAAMEIRPAEDGAPQAFLFEQPMEAAISLSHSAGVAACAVAQSGVALGCDIEEIERHSPTFAADYFTEAEIELVAQATAADRPLLETLIWSAKESVLKALRVGLRADTRQVTVMWGAEGVRDGWLPLQAQDSSREMFHGWWREAGGVVRTVVAVPAPAAPIPLEPARAR